MIDITNINVLNKGNILATCTVHIRPWKLKINEVIVFQKGQNRWISLPSRKFDKDGETKYFPLMEFDDNGADKRFRDQIMTAIDAYISKNGDLTPEDTIKNDPFPF